MLKFLFVGSLLYSPGPGMSCPALLYLKQDLPGITGPRHQIRLFTWNPRNKSWKTLPVQVDPMNKNGGLLFDLPGDWVTSKSQESDRIVFDADSFGPLRKPAGLPCSGPVLYRIRDFNNLSQGAFITVCPLKNTKKPLRVIYQEKEKRLYSSNYSYSFDENNAMLFRSVFITKETRRFLAAYHSDINIYSDIPKFIDLHFGAHNIESEIASVQKGVLGINANVSFFVKILFLRLKLSLSTDVSFYDDSAHIPMVLYLPVNPEEYLANNSGILYTWSLSEQFAKSSRKINMPVYTPTIREQMLKDSNAFSRVGKKYCTDSVWCHYSIQVGFMGKPFVMQFSLPKKLIQKGFFPVYTRSPKQLAKDLAWDMEPGYKDQDREGVFFRSSGLSTGNSTWDFWLKLGGLKKGRGGLCPYPVTVKRML